MIPKFVVEGGNRLSGELVVQGAKNSVLPLLAATILAKGQCVLHNCPKLSDVDAAIEILENFGCLVRWEKNTIMVDSSPMTHGEIPHHLMRKMRSSVMFLGAVLGRMGEATMFLPGGCELGPRPIDLHIEALKKLGGVFLEEGGKFSCNATKLAGTTIHLGFPSVGATENIMLAAVKAQGVTTIINAAREPEIEDLQNFLNAMGARVSGAGSSNIMICGVSSLHGATHTVIPDRIAAATYLCAVAATGGDVVLRGVNNPHLQGILFPLIESGCHVKTQDDMVFLEQKEKILPVKTVQTMPYPGFPTDAQSVMMAYLARGQGTSLFIETIFENRYKQAAELCRMGADIKVLGRSAVVYGCKRLYGAQVECTDLRGGAALMVAALSAEGKSEIFEIHHIERGYENFIENLCKLGACVERK